MVARVEMKNIDGRVIFVAIKSYICSLNTRANNLLVFDWTKMTFIAYLIGGKIVCLFIIENNI